MQDLSAFRALHASPFNLGSAAAGGHLTGLQLPANAKLAIVTTMAIAQNDITVSIAGHTNPVGVIGGPAGTEFRIGWHERGQTLTINRSASCPAGSVALYVLDPSFRRQLIASGVFS
jgi:hypothetical protein